MSNFRIMLLSTAAVGLVGALASPASAGEVEKSASFSGHVNRVIGVQDNGDNTNILNEDNSASMSRIRFVGSASSESLTVTTNVELRIRGQRNSTGNASAETGHQIDMRRSSLGLSGSFGNLELGESDSAGDLHNWFAGDFSGANWWGAAAVASASPFANEFLVKNAGNTTGAEESTLASVSPNLAASRGRGAVIRYDTPDFNGFSGSIGVRAGAQANEESSASIGYAADFDGTEVGFGYSYTNMAGSSTSEKAEHSVGAGISLAAGVNLHGSYFRAPGKAATDIDRTLWQIGVGYEMNAVDAGTTSIGLVYNNGDETIVKNDDFKSYGLNVNQSLADYGTDIYGGISRSEYDVTGTNYEDITAGWVGVRVKF